MSNDLRIGRAGAEPAAGSRPDAAEAARWEKAVEGAKASDGQRARDGETQRPEPQRTDPQKPADRGPAATPSDALKREVIPLEYCMVFGPQQGHAQDQASWSAQRRRNGRPIADEDEAETPDPEALVIVVEEERPVARPWASTVRLLGLERRRGEESPLLGPPLGLPTGR